MAADPIRRLFAQVGSADAGFVVGQVHDATTPFSSTRYPTVGPWWVTSDARTVSPPIVIGSLRRVVKGEVAGDVGEAHGEQRRRHVGGDAVRQRLHRRWRAPHVHFDVGQEQRTEEPETLQMVHVEVREEHVHELDGVLLDHLDAERTHAGAGVEDDRLTIVATDLDA